MPKPENVIGKGNRFSSTNQPKNRGRKPSLYTHIRKLLAMNVDIELSKEDYYKIIAFLMERPFEDLKKIARNEKIPVWIITLVKAMANDINAGRMTTLDSLFDRLFGKAQQPVTNKNESTIEIKGSIPIQEWVKDRLQNR